jgi:hypothetical protein
MDVLLKNQELKQYVKSMAGPLGTMIYNEIYVYIWFICIYNVFLIFLVLANFVLLLKLLKTSKIHIPDIVGS